jgi:hypothetical protein
MKLIAQLHVVPRLRMHGVITGYQFCHVCDRDSFGTYEACIHQEYIALQVFYVMR